LASPDQFIPVLPAWVERSQFIARHGLVDFFHFDYYSQALAKLERSHQRDLLDVQAMIDRNLIDPNRLGPLFLEIESLLIRFPSINADVFKESVDKFGRR
jgi:hypothetical protein